MEMWRLEDIEDDLFSPQLKLHSESNHFEKESAFSQAHKHVNRPFTIFSIMISLENGSFRLIMIF